MAEDFKRHVNDPCDLEPRGYDGFGAPIYDHQEDTMPTDLPPGFTGTGKPRKTERQLVEDALTADAQEVRANTNDGPDEARLYVDDDLPLPVTIVVTLVALAILGSVGMASVWVAFWFATHLPGIG